MGILKDKHISVDDNNSTALFENLFPGQDFTQIEYTTPKDYVQTYWNAYTASAWYQHASEQAKRSVNGKMFEYIISTLFIREGIVPFYVQAQVQYVPNVDFDIILVREDRMVAISLKTSLRERYKQADLEAFALKNVHRKSKCYLFTINYVKAADINAVTNIKQKIQDEDVLGIDYVVAAVTDEFNDTITDIKSYTHRRSLCKPEISNASDNNLVLG